MMARLRSRGAVPVRRAARLLFATSLTLAAGALVAVLPVALLGCSDSDVTPAGAERSAADPAEIPEAGVAGFPARFFEGTGTVRGRLLAHPGGEAVAGVSVWVGEQPGRATTSGPAGRFAVSDVPAGLDVRLALRTPEGAVRWVSGINVQPEATADVGTLWLGGALAWSGVVTDPQGVGLAGAVVTLHEPIQADFTARSPAGLGFHRRPPARARAVTDSAGAYHFEAVARGPVVVVVRAPGHAPALSRVNLALVKTRDGVYHRATELAVGLPVNGIVWGKDGAPLAGAAVVLVADFTHGTSALTARCVQTDADGRFQLAMAAGETERLFVFAGTTFFAWGERLGPDLEIRLR